MGERSRFPYAASTPARVAAQRARTGALRADSVSSCDSNCWLRKKIFDIGHIAAPGGVR